MVKYVPDFCVKGFYWKYHSERKTAWIVLDEKNKHLLNKIIQHFKKNDINKNLQDIKLGKDKTGHPVLQLKLLNPTLIENIPIFKENEVSSLNTASEKFSLESTIFYSSSERELRKQDVSKSYL